ncbi:hypothetical protein V8C35DRAFT_325628 [Trichoderma chlorosporum]
MQSDQLDGETGRDLVDKDSSPAGPWPLSSEHTTTYFSTLQQGPLRSRAESFLASVDWLALREYTAAKRNGINCSLLSDVPIINLAGCHPPEGALKTKSDSYEDRSDCSVKAAFMLMDCLEANVGMDLGMEIPPEYKQDFLSGLAKMHVSPAVRLPQIGTIVSLNADGRCRQGPILGLGGVVAKAKFGMTEEKLREASGPYTTEIVPSVLSFPESISRLAGRLSVLDCGPLPLCHGDFGHNNIVVDDAYRILGIIDCGTAFAGPWEIFGEFPLTLSTAPPAMDVSWNYNEDGSPKDADLAHEFH